MDEDKLSMKDIPSYHWPTKEEGKAQYPKFAKDFQGTLKGLRIVVEPGGMSQSHTSEQERGVCHHPPSQVRSLDETRLGGADVGVCLTFLLLKYVL